MRRSESQGEQQQLLPWSVGIRLDKNALIQLVPQKKLLTEAKLEKLNYSITLAGESLGTTAQIIFFKK